MEMINAEIFTLTYGSIVRQLLSDLEDIDAVNKQLDQMGYNMGIRLIDEFLAKAKITSCGDFRETADKIAKQGFRSFLSTTATVDGWNAEGNECNLILEDNPLNDFVELPEGCSKLRYSNLICGVIRGALEMVNMSVTCQIVQDRLWGDNHTVFRLKLVSHGSEAYPFKDDD